MNYRLTVWEEDKPMIYLFNTFEELKAFFNEHVETDWPKMTSYTIQKGSGEFKMTFSSRRKFEKDEK